MRAIGIVVLLVAGLAARGVAQPSGLSRAGVAAACRDILEEARRQGLSIGFSAMTVGRGETILRAASDRLFVPASNMKVVTVATALLGLGAGHTILTDVVAHGRVQGGTLEGPLRLRGEGDPTLSAKAVDVLAAKVKASGIRRILGGLLVDDRAFDQEFQGPAWPDDAPTEEYMAEVSALSLEHGTVLLRISAGARAGQPATVRVIPENGAVKIVNRLTTTGSKKEHVIGAVRAAGENVVTVSGKVVLGTKDQEHAVAIHDPSLVFGAALVAALAREGVIVDGPARRPAGDECSTGGRLLARVETPIAEVVPVLLKESQNHRAEMLWKHLGAFGRPQGSFRSGAEVATEILGKAGVDLRGARFADGSGLSRDNLVSADQLVAILRAAWRGECRELFVSSLPAGGERGATLRRRLHDLGPKVHAKTGSLRGISSLSGFVTTLSGETIAFSILVRVDRWGRLSPHDAQDRLVRALHRLRDAP